MPKLRRFQREDVDLIKHYHLRAIVASAPGVGKTPISIASLSEMGMRYFPTLVICPASVTHNWKKEFKTWSPGVKTQVLSGLSDKLNRRVDVYIISWALIEPRCSELLKVGFHCIIGDEAHLARNPEALRTQALYRLTRGSTKGLLLLTGTPIVNIEEELESLKALYETGSPPMIRRLLEDVAPDIPPKKRSHIDIKLKESAQREYDRAEDDFENWLRAEKENLLGEGLAEAAVERTLAAEAFAKVGYLRRLLGEAKVPAAVDWVSKAVRLGEPVVVFLEHQGVLGLLVKGLRQQRIRHSIIEGKTTTLRRQKHVDDFQRNKFPVLICTRAGAEGITLTAARHTLFLERFFTSAVEEQAEDRTRRIGQIYATTMWYLHVPGTIDDRLDEIVSGKRHIIREAIGSAETQDTPTATVESLVASWDHFANGRKYKMVNLGLGELPPPLPLPGLTHAVIFSGKRWDTSSALKWCRMHGYEAVRGSPYQDGVKILVHPVEAFAPGKFKPLRVCRDISMISGKRREAKNERAVRQLIKHNRSL